MRRPQFGTEPNRVLCDICREVVMRPYRYRGLRGHRGCIYKRSFQDHTSEILAPRANEAERIMEELLDSNPTSLA